MCVPVSSMANGGAAGGGGPGGRKRARLWLRGIAAALLVAVLLYMFDAETILQRLASVDRTHVALAFVALSLQFLLGASRWHYILLRHGLRLPVTDSLAIYGMAGLANVAVSHSVAGLSVKGVMLRDRGIALSRIAGVLLVERLAAACGLAISFAISAVLSFPLLRKLLSAADWRLAAGALAGTAVIGIFSVLGLSRLLSVRKFAGEIRSSFLNAWALGFLALLSAAIVYTGFLGVALLAPGMNIDVDASRLMIVLPLVAFAAALPVSLGGWGVREGMMVATLSLFGVPAAAALALSISYGLMSTATAVLFGGAMALLRPPGHKPDPDS